MFVANIYKIGYGKVDIGSETWLCRYSHRNSDASTSDETIMTFTIIAITIIVLVL